MSALSVLALVGSARLATAYPSVLFSRAQVPKFPAGTSWDILLSGGDISVAAGGEEDFQVIDIDLFDTTKETIADLKATKRVICYFSAGSKEGWRSDDSKFKESDYRDAVGGGPEGDWPDEFWLDVTSANVKKIMKERIEKAAQAGCDAVDPDNVDGWDNETGFDHPKERYVEYVKYMAQVAKDNGLAIGLKNAVDMIEDLVDTVDFAVNEQCHEYEGECAKYKPFTTANKAVYNIEYGGDRSTICVSPAGVKLSTLIKSEDQDLNELGGACPGQGAEIPTVVEPSVPASSTTPSNIPKPTKSKTVPTPGENNDNPAGNEENDEEEEEEEEEEKEKEKVRKPFRWNWWRHWN